MSYRNRECPTDSYDAFREGRRSQEYDRNPYEHGRDFSADRDCREANDEWARGARYAQYDREDQQRETEERRQQERRAIAREQETAEYEQCYAAQMEEEALQAAHEEPEPDGSAPNTGDSP